MLLPSTTPRAVPLWNVFARFLRPLAGWRRHVCGELEPFWRDDRIAVAGVNTARSWTWKGGRIDAEQIAGLADRFRDLPDDVVSVVVAHHPFDLPPGHGPRDLVGRARMAMEALAPCGVDLFLTGHLHVHHAGATTERYRVADHGAVVAQAGTATSTRSRGEPNSFNVIRIAPRTIEIEPHLWHTEREGYHKREARPPRRFERKKDVWREMEAP